MALLLEAGADINKLNCDEQLPIHYAYLFHCVGSVQLLIEAESAFYSGSPDSRLHILWCAIESRDPEILQAIITTLVRRRRRLQIIAEDALPSLALDKLNWPHDRILDEQAFRVWKAPTGCAIPIQKSLRAGPISYSVYHVQNLNAKIAADLFNAGFYDVDNVNEHGQTPLIQSGCQIFYNMSLAETLKLGVWLRSKGAYMRRNLRDSNG